MSKISPTNEQSFNDEENTFVITRTGRKVLLDPNRITQRLRQLIRRTPKIKHVNPFELMIKVTQSLKSLITTYEIDEYSANIAASLSLTNPYYMALASRIVVDNHQKATLRSFTDKMERAYLRKDSSGKVSSLLSKEFFQYVEINQDYIENVIDYSRDFLFDFFGFRTFQRLYGIKMNGRVIERPQDMYMRTSIALHMNTQPRNDEGLKRELERIKETYDLLSTKKYTQASPTYFNAGSNHTQYSSCFLMGSEDSLEGIMETGTDAAAISKRGGGIGIHVNGWRSSGALIRGTNGASGGIIPFLRIYNNIMRAFNQGGKRMGSAAIYLMPHHPDIMKFLELKLPGGEETERAHDLFYGLWIPDIFMERVKSNGKWSLFDPDATEDLSNYYGAEYEAKYLELEKQKLYCTQLNARDVWEAVYISNEQKGVPYIAFSDHVNRQNNQMNLGAIKSSNLCVGGDTQILTDKGYERIDLLVKSNEGKHVIWNGFEFSEARFAKTGTNKHLLRVTMSDGVAIDCTPEHRFILASSTSVKNTYIERIANELKIGDELLKHTFPVIDKLDEKCMYPYTHGFLCGDDTHGMIEGRPVYSVETDNIRTFDIADRHVVPFKASLVNRLLWLGGYLDADGMMNTNGVEWNIEVTCTDKKFLMDVKLMCNTMGTNPMMCENRLIFTVRDTSTLYKLGMRTYRFKWNGNETNDDAAVYVKSIVSLDGVHDTYCFNEPSMHMGIFNGIIAGNCIEIMEYSDEKEHAVCNLCSISLAACVVDKYDEEDLKISEVDRRELNDEFPLNAYFDFNILKKMVKVATVNLNNIIDKNFYPTEKTKRSNLRHRPIGIGVQGLADAYCKLRYPFESKEAGDLNKKIFECMYYTALSQSTRMSRETYLMHVKTLKTTGSVSVDSYNHHNYDVTKICYRNEKDIPKHVGAYPSMKWGDGAPLSKGVFHWELFKLDERELSGMWDWDTLREHIKTYGTVNSLVIALPPTASTSQLLGNNECFEPYTSNIYKRKTLAGEFIVINKYLINDLYRLGLWNNNMKDYLLSLEGSIQGIEGIPSEIKKLYKTTWEIDQGLLIDRAADRQPFIDQSQSLNLYVENLNVKLFNKLMFQAWRRKLKTGKYYVHTRPASMPQKFTIDPDKEVEMRRLLENESARKKHTAVSLEPLVVECDLCGA